MLAQHFLSNVKITRITHGIIFEEDYNSVIIFEITLAQNFLSNVSRNLFLRKNKVLELVPYCRTAPNYLFSCLSPHVHFLFYFMEYYTFRVVSFSSNFVAHYRL